MELSTLGLLLLLILCSYSGHAAGEETPKAVLVLDPDQTQFYTGESVTLRCSIEGQDTSGWRFIWCKDGQICYQQEAWRVWNEYTVQPLHVSHSGDYTCSGVKNNTHSRVSEGVKLQVLDLPTAAVTVVSPQPPFYPGDTVTLSCDIAEHTHWGQYDWYKDSDQISSQNRETITISLPDDAGQYTCKGHGGIRPRNSQSSTSFSISVTAFPELELTVQTSHVFTGETVTLTCAIHPTRDWTYVWYKHGLYVFKTSETNTYTISRATMSDQGEYMCYGVRESSGTYSPQSNTVQITVEELPLATLTVEPQSPVFTGETVTLKCLMEFLSGWTYKWYKGPSRTPVSEGNTFTIRGAAESHKGQYWCQGERRDRPTASQPSRKITLDVKASKPKVTLSPDHQLLTGDSVTLRCELLGVSSGLAFYWYRDTQTSYPVAQTDGNSYSISSVKVSDGGQYWCRAGRGDPVFYTQYSDAVEIKCIEGDVILESPVHPVTEGDPLTLRCRYRYPSNISADFYKDGTLLQTSTTGEMTIPAVSKAHEGLYKCSNTERGESPESRVTVRVLDSGSSELVVEVGVVIRLLIAFALVILLAILLYHSYKVKGSGTVERNLDQQLQTTNQSRDPDQTTNQSSDPDQRTNQSSDRDQRNQIQSAGREGTQSEYMPLQKRSTDDYYTLTPLYMPLQKGTTDVYETIESSKDS